MLNPRSSSRSMSSATVVSFTRCAPARSEVEFEYKESADQLGGNRYYYVRVIQQNGDIAWGSPCWVKER